MRVCRVLGPVVSTIKHESYRGEKLMVVQPLDESGQPAGTSYLALDRVQSGVGDVVLVMTEGSGVRQIYQRASIPIRSLIVGVVDELTIWGNRVELTV